MLTFQQATEGPEEHKPIHDKRIRVQKSCKAFLRLYTHTSEIGFIVTQAATLVFYVMRATGAVIPCFT